MKKKKTWITHNHRHHNERHFSVFNLFIEFSFFCSVSRVRRNEKCTRYLKATCTRAICDDRFFFCFSFWNWKSIEMRQSRSFRSNTLLWTSIRFLRQHANVSNDNRTTQTYTMWSVIGIAGKLPNSRNADSLSNAFSFFSCFSLSSFSCRWFRLFPQFLCVVFGGFSTSAQDKNITRDVV